MATVLVDLAFIDEDPHNPRGDVGDVTDLKQSIAQDGQQDPLHLIPQGNGRYFLHEGHRRREAIAQLNADPDRLGPPLKAKAIERHFTDDLSRLISQGNMHAHRKNWDPMAWSRYLNRLFEEHKLLDQAIARRLGVSQNFVREHLSFMHLHDYEQRALERGEITRKEALHRLAVRRAERDGTPLPATKKAAAKKTPATKTARSADDPYLTHTHRLAETVAARCATGGLEHAARPKIGGVGCGQCWEDAIRDDATTAVSSPVLAAVAA